MPNQKILYVTTEMFPYQEESNMAMMVNKMALKMHQEGNDVRVFMPRFGLISERKFQLHEVIRLSLPGERLQVYFIDNEEYFKRKQYYFDDNGESFSDNDERAIFFARGVIETIKKLNWVPDIIHINGWMASFIPIYLKNYYKTDSYFSDTKIVLSMYNEKDALFEDNIKEKLEFDNIKDLKALENPTFQNFVVESMKLVDTVVKGDEFLEENLDKAYEESDTKKFDYVSGDSINEVY